MNERWEILRRWTAARIGLARTGEALSTSEWLRLQWAHAAARDSVHTPWDWKSLQAALEKNGDSVVVVPTEAASRSEFLLRPDRGRSPRADELRRVAAGAKEIDVLFCVSDGLSAKAVAKHFLSFWHAFRPAFVGTRLRLGPVVIVPFGRVAAADAIGDAFRAKVVVIAVGERPGMSASDSLGLYLTFGPRAGRNDAERNCLSNIRPPGGMGYDVATKRLLFLLSESLRRGLSGVALKDESALGGAPPTPLPR